jgi:hypothetical protein
MNTIKISIEIQVDAEYLGTSPATDAELRARAEEATCKFIDVPHLPRGFRVVVAECLQAIPRGFGAPIERLCTCVGVCKGPEGLAPGWTCVLEQQRKKLADDSRKAGDP